MPRLRVPGFIGGANPLQSRPFSVEDTINLYVQPGKPGTSRTEDVLLKRWGLTPFAQVNDSPGHFSFFQDGRGFTITGNTFAEVFEGGTVTNRGAITGGSNHYSIVSNGTAGDQLLICDGFDGYVYDLTANTVTQINNTTFPGTGFPYGQALHVEFMDGYGIVLQRGSRKFFISALEDFTSWDPLDVAERSEGSDNLVTCVRNHRELWFPGTKTGEVWYDSGDPLFPFAPVPGVFLEMGATGGISASGGQPMCRFINTVAWLGQNEAGSDVLYLADGYNWTPIATPAFDWWAQALVPANQYERFFLFATQQQGHDFLWVLNPNDASHWTWVYDALTKAWVKWAHWDATQCIWTPHRANSHMFAWGKHLVTSYTDGTIYQLDPENFGDRLI